MQHDSAGMGNGSCEVRRTLREAVSVRARTLLEMRARLSGSRVPNEMFTPVRADIELTEAIAAYRRALREFESHVGQHRCD
jgi:hypothetical protein